MGKAKANHRGHRGEERTQREGGAGIVSVFSALEAKSKNRKPKTKALPVDWQGG
jgi:hypothetical protein